MDIVYPVRPGESNDELRFSLRSLEVNYPAHDKVWLVGFMPSWVSGVGFISGNATDNARTNVYANVLAAMQHPDVADDVVVFNDDFFVTTPVGEVTTMYRGTLDDHLALPGLRNKKSWWTESLAVTKVCLQAVGVEAPLSYELHVPLPCTKQLMRETLEQFVAVTPDNPPQWRSLYGNLHAVNPAQVKDCKAFSPGKVQEPFHSTSDVSWRHYRAALTKRFPAPSRYEVTVDVCRQKVRA